MSVFNLMVIDLGGETKTRVVFDHHDPGADRPPHPAPMFPLPADSWDGPDRIVYTAGDGLANRPAAVDLGTGAGKAFDPADAPDSRLAKRARLTAPGDVFLKDRLIGPQKGVRWKSPDGLEIEGVLTFPPEGVGKAPHKLIVYPHGGPHGRNVLGFDFTVQVFAAHGYAVFQPNFRGSTGYGQRFVDADRGDFGGGDMHDVLSGVDHLIAEGVADKDRLFAYGTSFGGYMTAWMIGQTNRFRAAAPVNGVHDLTMMWALSDLQSWTEWEFGGRPWEVPEKMLKHSPLSYAGRVKAPTLVLHALNDRRVPHPLGVAYHRALQRSGVPTELVTYPDEGHAIRQPRHREDLLRRVLAWFAKHDKP